MDDRFLTAQEAAAELGISLATLYAYASRGMLRSEAVPGEPRARRYPKEDVLRLKDKKELRRYPEQAAEKAVPKALSWGLPVLESALTLIRDGRLYYRGRDAVELARTATVEEVAALLWTGDAGEAERLFAGAVTEPPRIGWHLVEGLTPIERCQVAVPLAGAADLSAWDLRPAAVAATGARILRLMATVAAGTPDLPGSGVAATLQAGWAPERP
jgi:citrate synthase